MVIAEVVAVIVVVVVVVVVEENKLEVVESVVLVVVVVAVVVVGESKLEVVIAVVAVVGYPLLATGRRVTRSNKNNHHVIIPIENRKREKKQRRGIQPEPRLPHSPTLSHNAADRRRTHPSPGPSWYLIHKFTNNATVANTTQHRTGSRGVTVPAARGAEQSYIQSPLKVRIPR